MDQSNNPLILKGQSIYKFLQELHTGNDGVYPQSKVRTDDGYKLFKSSVMDLRDFISKSLDYPEVQELLGEQDEITQARIRNITSPYHQYEQVDMLSADLSYNTERKKDNYKKNLKNLQNQSPETQKILWEQRVEGSIWNEESGSLIARFILDILEIITSISFTKNPKSINGSYMVGDVLVDNPMKNVGIGLNVNNGEVTYNGNLVDTLTGVSLDFFKVLFALCRNKRVPAKEICIQMGIRDNNVQSYYGAHLRKICGNLENEEIKGWIEHGVGGYLLHDK